jgi:hypothetical protein
MKGQEVFAINGTPVSSHVSSSRGENSDPVISRLQNKQKIFENGVERFPACDTKAQEVLKLIRSDPGLWEKIQERLEVRVIKKAGEEEIVLHPKDEPEERWSGKYHIYVTIQHEGKRLVIDPYIGGRNSCAHVDEREFIDSHWKGEEGKDYTLETIAPTAETYVDDDYTPEFSVTDYMYNLFDPDTFEAHRFFYD